MSLVHKALVCAVLLGASAAQAWPVDVYVDLEAGRETFRKLSALAWVEVEDPSIATAEVLPSGELLLTGRTPGRTLLLLYAEGKFAVWRLRVAPEGERVEPFAASEAVREAVKKACPRASVDERVVATVPDERCRSALAALLETDAFSARDLEITFELPALQAQLAAIQARLEAAGLGRVEPRYVGAGLVLEGDLTAEAHRKALWALFRASVGRVPLQDGVRVSSEAP